MTIERFPVEESHIMMFARAIGDPNPVYDPSRRRRRSSPRRRSPWRARSSTPRTSCARSSARSGSAPAGADRRQAEESSGGGGGGGAVVALHAEQHFEYHRHVRAGDVLTGT